MVDRVFSWLLDHRLATGALALALCVVLGFFAARVRPDYSVENLFPVWDPAREVYDRYKESFPFDDARALLIVEADDLFTPGGLARIGRLEQDLAQIEGVVDVEGPLSIDDVVAQGDMVGTERLFPGPDLAPDDLAARLHTATTDPLFLWNLVTPDASAVTIRISLTPERASSEHARRDFLHAVRAVMRQHERQGQHLSLSGMPVVRGEYEAMTQRDTGMLIPLALLVVLVLVYVSFRSLAAVFASFMTMLAALLWSYGVMGILGYPLGVLTSVTPIVVIIISLSDTVHVIHGLHERLRAGEAVPGALHATMAEVAVACLLTEVTIACGFLTLVAVNIVAVYQFGIATACAMLLTWLANMLVLPLCLLLTRPPAALETGAAVAPPRPEAPAAVRAFSAFIDLVERQVIMRPGVVVVVALLLFAVAGGFAARVERLYYVFDDLRPGSLVARELRVAERVHGGVVPLAIFVEPVGGERDDNAGLEPEVVRVLDDAATFLRGFDEIEQANSVADYVRKAHRILAGEEAAAETGGLPSTRRLTAQEVEFIDDGRMLRDVLSHDRRAAAAFTYVRDTGSKRIRTILAEVRGHVAGAQDRLDEAFGQGRYRVSCTGVLAIIDDINEMLVGGLIASFGGAIFVTFLVFCIVLRSWRLGVIGLVPNVSPVLLIFGFMGAMGIDLKPSTVIVFSITLVIADDDTIQFLARFREHYRRALAVRPALANPHSAAAISCLREVGLPMFVTSVCVSAGFLLLVFSNFLGLKNLGVLIGVTLFAAVFADLFLTPILLGWWRPPLSVPEEPTAEPTGSGAADGGREG